MIIYNNNSYLFFKVWGIYNNGQFQKIFRSIKQFDNYQFKNYLNNIFLDIGEKREEEQQLSKQNINNENYNSYNRNNINNLIKLPKNIIKIEIFKNFIYSNLKTSLNNYDLSRIECLQIDIHFDQNYFLKTLKPLVHLKSLHLGINFNSPITAYSLPSNLTSLNVGSTFNQKIEENSLSVVPLKYLEFGLKFNQPLEIEGLLPDTLESLKFNGNFNMNLLYLPSSLKELSFESFNQPIEYKQFKSASSLRYLNMGKKFNNIISSNSLPDSLEIIDMGSSFNCEFFSFDLLPTDSLKSIHMGDNFNQSIELQQLPHTVESICFGNSFNQLFDANECYDQDDDFYFHNSYSNLKEIVFGNSYNQPFLFNSKDKTIFNGLYNLQSIEFGLSYNQQIPVISFLKQLKKIVLGNGFNQNIAPYTFPQTLEHLSFGDDYHQDLQEEGEYILPSSLTYLSFGSSFRSPLNHLLRNHLTNLCFLRLGGSYQHHISPNELPKSLKTLEYKTNCSEIPIDAIPFNSLIIHPHFYKQIESIPPSVTNINFPETLKKQLVQGSLPSTIKSIVFYNYYYDLVPNSIPGKVESIQFKSNYNREIQEGSLPNSVKYLFIGDGNPILKYNSIPDSLKTIYCYNTNNRFIENSIDNNFYHLLKIIKK
ncbi:hypothetical protein DICPUDRAFT_80130 [Dictyostelium purpureum]|uniref:FNIP repeat-containing protein n=1 Tax=Dictyostelium purpureum TaxID=5786 RepID=F0ZPM3_DICPU|nr:uncharacterized protein DICPUDRAFT_80130 [Dictyostelium purpureum]EGC34111.1 hypothetical protein DICPUDRAFT_80130 [Dictyostelium purpureum]|eukprot:XP_003289357.1 hypothetical protein DICPUDRAFT_80130 [Dictyostelium purpureum]